jgi:CRP-like cAMP-binding protein
VSAPGDNTDSAASEAAEEASWELTTAEALQRRGELTEAASWYRRAAEHLMDAGDDDRAVEVARLAAELMELSRARGAPSSPEAAALVQAPPQPPPVLPPAPPTPRAAMAHAPLAAPVAPAAAMPQVAHGPPATPVAALEDLSADVVTQAFPSVPPQGPYVPNPFEAATDPEFAQNTAAPQVVTVDPPAAVVPQAFVSTPPTESVEAPSAPPSEAPAPSQKPSQRPSFKVPLPPTVAAPPGITTTATHFTPVVPLAAHVTAAPPMIEPSLRPGPTFTSTLRPAAAASETPSQRRVHSYLPSRGPESDQLAHRLPALPVFAELPLETLRVLARQATVVQFRAGSTMIDGAALGGPMLALTTGTALVWFSRNARRGIAVGATAGDLVGELGAYFGGLQVTTVTAETDVEAVAFAPSMVRALARDFSAFRTMLHEVAWERAFEALHVDAPLLQRVDATSRAAVLEVGEYVRLQEGDAMLVEGTPSSAVWIVAAGEVELYGGDLGLGRLRLGRAGDAFGLVGVLGQEPFGVSARAVREVLAARIEARAFRALANAHPELGRALDVVGIEGSGILC